MLLRCMTVWVVSVMVIIILLLSSSSSSSSSSSVSQAFSHWYFSWTIGDPPRSNFKFHTAVLSVLCAMFLVQLSVVVNLLNVFLVWLPNVSVKLLLLFRWLQLLSVYSHISYSTLVVSLYIKSCILDSFPLPFAWHFCPRVLPHLSECMFSLLRFHLLHLAYLLYLLCLRIIIIIIIIIIGFGAVSSYWSLKSRSTSQHRCVKVRVVQTAVRHSSVAL